MLACALAVVPVMAADRVSGLWAAVLLVGLAAGAHQAWSANIFTFASDMFPKRSVGSVTGLGGMAGAIGGMLFSTLAGHILQWTGSYLSLFVISGSAYLVAFGIIQILVPKLDPVRL
jgi:ACS family hexuronate transporter-like MFS transporter